MGLMYEPIENRIGEGGVGNARMPSGHGNLRGNQRGGAPIAIVQDFQHITRLSRRQQIAQPVVEDGP
jgi:hypothetical protein